MSENMANNQPQTESVATISSNAVLGVNRDKLQYRLEKWKAERLNKQREMLILKTEVETLERVIGETEDIINDKRNLQPICGQ
jgi:hypothetical protein